LISISLKELDDTILALVMSNRNASFEQIIFHPLDYCYYIIPI
jgi:hypothetical protein